MIKSPNTVQELINDPSFRAWAKDTSMPQSESWNKWVNENPENQNLAKEGAFTPRGDDL